MNIEIYAYMHDTYVCMYVCMCTYIITHMHTAIFVHFSPFRILLVEGELTEVLSQSEVSETRLVKGVCGRHSSKVCSDSFVFLFVCAGPRQCG